MKFLLDVIIVCALMTAPLRADDEPTLIDRTLVGRTLEGGAWIGSSPATIEPQTVRADITVHGTRTQYAALILDDDGSDNIFVKVQQNDEGGMFNTCGFYRGNNEGAWPEMTGGHSFIFLSARFHSARMKLEHDGAGNVTLTLSDIDPPQPDQVYQRGGWRPRQGDGFGMGGYAGFTAIDNFQADPDGLCDDFNRADGPLGEDWADLRGVNAIAEQSARCAAVGRANFIGVCGGINCAAFRRLKTTCRGNTLKVRVEAPGLPGAELTLLNNDRYGRTIALNGRGRGKATWISRTGGQGICVRECAHLCGWVYCE